jgi:hypothetical protein
VMRSTCMSFISSSITLPSAAGSGVAASSIDCRSACPANCTPSCNGPDNSPERLPCRGVPVTYLNMYKRQRTACKRHVPKA